MNTSPKTYPSDVPAFLDKVDFADAVASAHRQAYQPFSSGPACGVPYYDETVFDRTH
jgi:hypothetical protein